MVAIVGSPRNGHTSGWTAMQLVIWAAGVRGEKGTPSYCMELTNWCTHDEIARGIRMTKKKKKGKEDKTAEFIGFVNIQLNTERKKAFAKWGKSWEDVITLFSELVLDDYRVSFAPANDGNAVQVSLTCRDKQDPNAGYCMTSRAPTWQDALTVAMWKHYDLCQRDWTEYVESSFDDDWG